ncbi:MAG: TetR/AcrR family transcriptional regulator [Rhodobacteraceae bacterium]|nr:MAG: TetR/AcrR family transcriptional regulator [Paracoccaceae bacterium]
MARSRAHDFEDKQRAILRSAAAVFAESGMDRASMSQIAARAEVSKALLYHYYTSRDALIFDILRTNLGELEAAILAADSPEAPPRERLRQLVHTILEQYRDADDYHKLQLNGTHSLPEAERAEILAIERRITRHVAGILRAIRPDIDANRPLLMPVTMSLFGMVNWVYMWFREGGPITREGYADLATDLLLGGIESLN